MLIMVAVTINLGHGDWWRRVVSGTAKTNKGCALWKKGSAAVLYSTFCFDCGEIEFEKSERDPNCGPILSLHSFQILMARLLLFTKMPVKIPQEIQIS